MQGKTPAYVIAEVEVTDPAVFRDYAAKAGATLAAYNARLITRGKARAKEGPAPAGNIVVIEFDSLADAERWYSTPPYNESDPAAAALRKQRACSSSRASRARLGDQFRGPKHGAARRDRRVRRDRPGCRRGARSRHRRARARRRLGPRRGARRAGDGRVRPSGAGIAAGAARGGGRHRRRMRPGRAACATSPSRHWQPGAPSSSCHAGRSSTISTWSISRAARAAASWCRPARSWASTAVQAAAQGTISRVHMITRKPPNGLDGAPYLVEHGISGARHRRSALRSSPATRARRRAAFRPMSMSRQRWRSPASAPTGRRSRSGPIPGSPATSTASRSRPTPPASSMQIENVPSVENPKTGRLTPLSVLALLSKLAQPARDRHLRPARRYLLQPETRTAQVPVAVWVWQWATASRLAASRVTRSAPPQALSLSLDRQSAAPRRLDGVHPAIRAGAFFQRQFISLARRRLVPAGALLAAVLIVGDGAVPGFGRRRRRKRHDDRGHSRQDRASAPHRIHPSR